MSGPAAPAGRAGHGDLPGLAGPHAARPPASAAGPSTRTVRPAGSGSEPSFARVLEQALQEQQAGLRFSAHARARLAQQGIAMDEATSRRLGEAVRRAEAKGAREAVVVLDGAAFVVSVRNRTVITVVDSSRWKESVFTQIDSVVFA
ncbi:MAG TPA: TIGR02530 family flagellar biosynthesis protein [Limnochordales bacterium]